MLRLEDLQAEEKNDKAVVRYVTKYIPVDFHSTMADTPRRHNDSAQLL